MKLLVVAVLVGSLRITAYRSVPSQTDATPFNTATGEHVSAEGVAVSQDLLAPRGPLHYGDWLYIDGIGFKRINDTMAARMRGRVDVWVRTYDEEKKIDVLYRRKRLTVWRVYAEHS